MSDAAAIIVVDLRALGLANGQDVFDFISTERGNGSDTPAIRAAFETALAAHSAPAALDTFDRLWMAGASNWPEAGTHKNRPKNRAVGIANVSKNPAKKDPNMPGYNAGKPADPEPDQGWRGPPVRTAALAVAPDAGGKRPVLSNFVWVQRWQADKKIRAKAESDPELRKKLEAFNREAPTITPDWLRDQKSQIAAAHQTALAAADEAKAEVKFRDAASMEWGLAPDPFWEKRAAEMAVKATRFLLDPRQWPNESWRKAIDFLELVEQLDAECKSMMVAKDIATLRDNVLRELSGWPNRMRAPGDVKLFLDSGQPEVSRISEVKDLTQLLKSYCTLKFNPGQDEYRTNYVTFEELHMHLGRSERVREWRSVDRVPHEPFYPDHYCNWRWPEGYKADGRTLAQFIAFFDQVSRPECRAVMAAAAITPFWGGPYSGRPCFLFDADQRGSGKTTAAELIAAVACPNGPMMINLDRRSEERVKERLLSPEGETKPIGIIDNIKGGSVASGLLEELITCTWISGKELGVGESSRPNTMTYFVTANGAELGDDMSSRAFRVHFDPLKEKGGAERAAWSRTVLDFVREKGSQLIADAIWMLRTAKPFDWDGIKGERNALWVEQVLGAVLSCSEVMAVVGEIGAAKVLVGNQNWRDESNEDLNESDRFRDGVYERIWTWKSFKFMGETGPTETLPKGPIFVRTEAPPERDFSDPLGDEAKQFKALKRNNMVQYYKEIFTRSDISAKWLVKTLKDHIVSGRLKGFSQTRDASQGGIRGWHVDHELLTAHMRAVHDAKEAKRKQEQDASEASEVMTHDS